MKIDADRECVAHAIYSIRYWEWYIRCWTLGLLYNAHQKASCDHRDAPKIEESVFISHRFIGSSHSVRMNKTTPMLKCDRRKSRNEYLNLLYWIAMRRNDGKEKFLEHSKIVDLFILMIFFFYYICSNARAARTNTKTKTISHTCGQHEYRLSHIHPNVATVGEYVWVQYKSLVLFKMHYNAESKSNTTTRSVRRWKRIYTHIPYSCGSSSAGNDSGGGDGHLHNRRGSCANVCLALHHQKKEKKRFFFVPQPLSMSSGIFGWRKTNDGRMVFGRKTAQRMPTNTFNCRRKTILFFSNFQHQNKEQFTIKVMRLCA